MFVTPAKSLPNVGEGIPAVRITVSPDSTYCFAAASSIAPLQIS